MKQLLYAVFYTSVATTLLGQPKAPGVYNIRAYDISHSTLRLVWENTQVPNKVRVRFGFTAAYENGPGGGIQPYETYRFGRVMGHNLSGLAPATTYNICPQTSIDNGATWSECVNVTATTLLKPAEHPAYPVPPEPVDTSYPDTTGYAIRNVAADCSDLQAHFNAAAAEQATRGSTILIQPGTVCRDDYRLPPGSDVRSFTQSAVTTSTATLTIPNHGFADGQRIRFGGWRLMGSGGPPPFYQYRGVKRGDDMYVKRVDANRFQVAAKAGGPVVEFVTSTFTADPANNTFTVPHDDVRLADDFAIHVKSSESLPGGLQADTTYYVKNANFSKTFQLSVSLRGPAIDITSAGSGTHSFVDPGGGGNVVAWPPVSNWIIVRTATPDAQFVPAGVRITPEWQPRMATVKTGSRWDAKNWRMPLAGELLAHHWRFIGIEFTHDDTASEEIKTTIDPHGHLGFVHFQRDSGYITFDRCYFHGLGFPNRIHRPFVGFDGAHMAMIDSYWDHFDWWHPYRDGVRPSLASRSSMRIGAGTYYTGPAARRFPNDVVILVGSQNVSGTGVVYLDMEGKLHVVLPEGKSGTCNGYTPCVVENAARPAFPYNNDPDPRMAGAPIATMTFTGDALTAVHDVQEPSTGVTEGTQSMIAGLGTGPYLIQNNYINATGIAIHFDDMGNGHNLVRESYTLKRNTFTARLEHVPGRPESNGRAYYNRHFLEFKSGSRILVDGNIFENNQQHVSPVACALAAMPVAGGEMDDIKVSNNIFRNNAASIGVSGPIDNNSSWPYVPSRPTKRVHIMNNLIYRGDGFGMSAKPFNSGAWGFQIGIGWAMEDVRIENNTAWDSRGTAPSFIVFAPYPIEGVSVTNNLIWANTLVVRNGGGIDMKTPACRGVEKELMDCGFVAGTGNPDYTWTGNVIIAGWANAEGTKAADPSFLRTQFTGLDSEILPLTEATLRFKGLSGRGVDTRDRSGQTASRAEAGRTTPGVDQAALDRALGVIRLSTPRDIGATSAKIAFTAPDKGAACYVLYDAGNEIPNFSRSAPNTADAHDRVMELNGLMAGFTYNYIVMCEGATEQPRSSFRTQTQ
jgi:hypothetical protein